MENTSERQEIEAERISYGEAEQSKRGELLAEVLGLKANKATGRYFTTWGDKSALGLFKTCKRIIGE